MSTKEGYPKGQAKREEIISATLTLIGQYGFDNLSLRDVADSVGLSQAGLLHYFSSKNELLTAVLREYDSIDLVFLKDTLVHSNYRHVLGALTSRSDDYPALTQLRTAIQAQAKSKDHPGHSFMINRYRTIIDTLEKVLAAEQEAGRLTPAISSKTLAQIISAFINGLDSQWMVEDPTEIANVITAFLSLLPPHSTP